MRDTFRWPETTGFLDGYQGRVCAVESRYAMPASAAWRSSSGSMSFASCLPASIQSNRYLAGYMAGRARRLPGRVSCPRLPG